ncbi:MAG: dephospho-CoA kinase [Pseudomonadota bacterium]
MNRPLVLGLTGSIGMGKSTTAGFFRDRGIPVWDADEAVRRVYAAGGAAVGPVGAEFPGAILAGAVDRGALRREVTARPDGLDRLERIVHPLVAADRAAFLAAAAAGGAPLVVLDVPLLFETGLDAEVDATVVVSAPPEIQRARVMARPGMTEDLFRIVLSRQTPDAEKRRRATWVVETPDLDTARAGVERILTEAREWHVRDRPRHRDNGA